MLSIEDNEALTQVSPGTPMGELMRRYWQPICAADQLLKSPFRTHEVKILGEELVVYRDRSGTLGVVDKYCTHRRASLAYGVVEDEGIRCQYHGWKFDETGACIEQPFEDTTHPEDNFRDKCGIKSYPVQELGGLVFVYMGPAPAPLLPRWAPLVWDNCVRDIAIAELPCSWLQCQENSLDPVHLEWLHGYAGGYFRKIFADNPSPVDEGYEPRHARIGFDVFEHGIIKRRTYKGQDESHDEWRVGHPVLFPNILLVGNPFQNTLQFRVPADDSHTLHFSMYTWRAAPGFEAPVQNVVPSRIVPLTEPDGRLKVDILFNQDYMCWITQGPVAHRELERLGESDKGIILFRRQLLQQMEMMRDGGEPTMNVFRDPAENECIELGIEPSRFGMGDLRKYQPAEAGYSADADKINAVMATWHQSELNAERVRELVSV
jgi:5,5'-dehydrodivanillate O-demethylase